MESTDLMTCKECRRTKLAADFYSDHWRKYVSTCAACRAPGRDRKIAKRAAMGPEGVRAENLRTKYGISATEYDGLRERQGYRCAICNGHEDDLPRTNVGRPPKDGRAAALAFKLVVDHCHESGRIRGLLCNPCNSALGLLKESESALKRALEYLGSP